MRRKLICGIGCFIFVIASSLAANAPACHPSNQPVSHHSYQSLERAFHHMDRNHDGILTQREFVAAHRQKMGTAQAAAQYRLLAMRGGTTTRNGTTGMTLHQFKLAHGVR